MQFKRIDNKNVSPIEFWQLNTHTQRVTFQKAFTFFSPFFPMTVRINENKQQPKFFSYCLIRMKNSFQYFSCVDTKFDSHFWNRKAWHKTFHIPFLYLLIDFCNFTIEATKIFAYQNISRGEISSVFGIVWLHSSKICLDSYVKRKSQQCLPN